MTATPGQRAYGALHASLLARNPDHSYIPWAELDELTRHADGWYRADLEAAGQAAIKASPELAAIAELATHMHAEADRIASPNCRRADATELARAQALHEAAARIRQLLGPEAS